MFIKPTDKILIIAPHPDDEVIACGGFITKYHNQIDVLCVNSSGVKYDQDTESAEEIAEIRCNEFKNVMELAGIKNYYITKIWGIPPMIKDIKNNFNRYAEQINFDEYDKILTPHINDEHIEHRFVTNNLLKKLLKKVGYKKTLEIMSYELWSPMQKINYSEDITEFVDTKRKLINAYKSRLKSHYAERILGLNKYRTLTHYFMNHEKYVECFYVENVQDFLGKGKIFSIKKQTKGNKKYIIIKILGFKIKIQAK